MVMIEIYMMCGRHEEAMDEIDELLSLESVFTANSLKFLSWLDPIREHPRFKELMTRYALTGDG